MTRDETAVLREALERARDLLKALPPEERAAYARAVRAIDEVLAPPEVARKDLLSVICHDLKDPLASILMGAGFLKKVLPADDALAPARRVVDAIYRSSERMNGVIGDFHDLGRLEAGTLVLERAEHDAAAIVRATFDLFLMRAKDKQVTLAQELEGGELRIVCDRTRAVQALGKLLANAIKFTPQSGTVTLILEPRPERAWFAVRDTGRGVPESRRATIFDREANARQTPRDGPGLGLAIVKGLVELHGGECGLRRSRGRGSTFWFALPRG
jgi:signal transduction histidine kinase